MRYVLQLRMGMRSGEWKWKWEWKWKGVSEAGLAYLQTFKQRERGETKVGSRRYKHHRTRADVDDNDIGKSEFTYHITSSITRSQGMTLIVALINHTSHLSVCLPFLHFTFSLPDHAGRLRHHILSSFLPPSE